MLHQIDNSKSNYAYNARLYRETVYRPHFHKNFELIYCMTGTVQVVSDGVMYELLCGECVLVPPSTVHSFTVEGAGQLWIGVFSSDHVPLFAQSNSDKLYSAFRCDACVENFLAQVLFVPKVPPKYLLQAALYAVCSQCQKNGRVLYEKADAELNGSILRYIYENLEHSPSLKQVAEALGYEYHYFSALFHRCFSMNFKELLNLCRFERACELLGRRELTLAAVALESGFQSIRSFNHTFKALSGMTPTEYRRRY